jgi:hypothetical protein
VSERDAGDGEGAMAIGGDGGDGGGVTEVRKSVGSVGSLGVAQPARPRPGMGNIAAGSERDVSRREGSGG